MDIKSENRKIKRLENELAIANNRIKELEKENLSLNNRYEEVLEWWREDSKHPWED